MALGGASEVLREASGGPREVLRGPRGVLGCPWGPLGRSRGHLEIIEKPSVFVVFLRLGGPWDGPRGTPRALRVGPIGALALRRVAERRPERSSGALRGSLRPSFRRRFGFSSVFSPVRLANQRSPDFLGFVERRLCAKYTYFLCFLIIFKMQVFSRERLRGHFLKVSGALRGSSEPPREPSWGTLGALGVLWGVPGSTLGGPRELRGVLGVSLGRSWAFAGAL